jgi:Uma2 family endonuclease
MTTAKTLLTADDLLAMPDDGKYYELVRGELVEVPPPGFRHEFVTFRFASRFGNFVEQNNLGVVVGGAGIYIEQDPDTVRAPDCAFVSHERIVAPLPDSGYVAGLIPDLIVEVISPDYPVAEAEARARMWLDSGVRLVLVAVIATREIIAYRDDGAVQRFGMGNTLTCEPVLPGFTCTVADFFNYP